SLFRTVPLLLIPSFPTRRSSDLDVGPSDLLIAVDAADDALPGALARAEAALTERARPAAGGFGDEPSPRTIGSAAEHADASLALDRKSTRLNSSHVSISYAVFCL